MPSVMLAYITELGGNVPRVQLNTPAAGRPRNPALDHQIIAATMRLLGEFGYAEMSMDAIAAAAGVTKPTIYRRWPTKAVLVADALQRRHSAMTTSGDAHDLRGSLRDDLLAMVLDDHRSLAAESGMILGVAFSARSDDDLHEALHGRFDQDIRARLDAVLDRAVARGEQAPGAIDRQFVLRTISSVLMGVMFESAPGGTRFLTRVVDDLLLPFLAPTSHLTARGPEHDR